MVVLDKTNEFSNSQDRSRQRIGPVTINPALGCVPKTFAAEVNPCFPSTRSSPEAKKSHLQIQFTLTKMDDGKLHCNICCRCATDL